MKIPILWQVFCKFIWKIKNYAHLKRKKYKYILKKYISLSSLFFYIWVYLMFFVIVFSHSLDCSKFLLTIATLKLCSVPMSFPQMNVHVIIVFNHLATVAQRTVESLQIRMHLLHMLSNIADQWEIDFTNFTLK